MSQLHDAIRSVLPAGTRSAAYGGSIRLKINCPLCHVKGHTRDTKQRGAIFLRPDGGAGYNCFQCGTVTEQAADMSLTRNMRDVLVHLGMSSEEVERLSYALWSAKIAKERGIAPPPRITKQPLPSGARTIGEWIADNIADENFNAVLLDLSDMTDERRDSLYWTPDAGPSLDMNRRFIWAIGPSSDPVGWAAQLIGDDETQPILSDPNIFQFRDADDE